MKLKQTRSQTARAIAKRDRRATIRNLGPAFLERNGIHGFRNRKASAIIDEIEKVAGTKFSPATRVIDCHALLISLPKAAPKPRKYHPFYNSEEWRAIRFDVLKANDGRCELCGASKHDGARLHVDHIKPRSTYPRLALEPTNLQVLCEDCNLGKSNRDETDWREPDHGDWWNGAFLK